MQSVRESKMKNLTLVAIILAAALLAGCGWSDNNCNGTGITNAEWCRDSLHPVAGPWAD
jgi:predicted small secreted protein